MFTKEKNAFKVIRNCPNWFIPTRIFLSLSSRILTIFLCSSHYQTSLITVSKLHLKRNACLMLSSQNIQSTNWQTMRFKPPPPNSSIGWRVEFRPTEVRWLFLPPPPLSPGSLLLEIRTLCGSAWIAFCLIWMFSFLKVQLTDFENAAYVTFVVLLTRVILSFDLNLLIPLSKVRIHQNFAYFSGKV